AGKTITVPVGALLWGVAVVARYAVDERDVTDVGFSLRVAAAETVGDGAGGEGVVSAVGIGCAIPESEAGEVVGVAKAFFAVAYDVAVAHEDIGGVLDDEEI